MLSFYDLTPQCSYYKGIILPRVWFDVLFELSCLSGCKQKDELMNVGQPGCWKRSCGGQEVQSRKETGVWNEEI